MNRKQNDMKKESVNDELENLSPLLRGWKQQKEGFQVPEGYFDTVEEAVFSRIDQSGNRRKPALETRRGGLFSRSQVRWAAAAVLALVLAATWFFTAYPPANDALPAVASQELTEEEIEAYVLANIRDFDEALLAEVPAGTQPVVETKPVSPAAAQPKQTDPIDDLSDEELDLLLKDMSDEELENLLKT